MSDVIAGTITPPSSSTLAGRTVVLAYSSAAAEYAALRSRAVVVDRSLRTRLRLHGSKAAEMLTGLVTNDVLSAAPGEGQYAAALSSKGKIVADVRIFVEKESILTDAPPRAGDAWLAMVKKFVNPRTTPHEDETATIRTIGVFGSLARHVAAEVTRVNSSALTLLPSYSHMRVAFDGVPMLVARSPELGVEGFEIFAPAEAFDTLWQRATHAGAVPCGLSAWEIARLEAGRPEWGIDMDDTTIPQEANFDELQAISYTKGCYVGQEVVARVHFKGHVNRHLRGLRAPEAAPPLSGATLWTAEGKEVGDVRSTATSPRLGGIAIGMVRREVEPGSSLTARWDGGEVNVDVSTLPFPLT
jgi:tRNA-modifying protein YgfZ